MSIQSSENSACPDDPYDENLISLQQDHEVDSKNEPYSSSNCTSSDTIEDTTDLNMGGGKHWPVTKKLDSSKLELNLGTNIMAAKGN